MLGQLRPLGARTPRVPSWTAESLVPQPSPHGEKTSILQMWRPPVM